MLLERIFRRIQFPTKSSSQPSTEARAETYPHPYPNAWYRIAASSDLKRGQTLYIECVGEQFVLFRSDLDDTVSLLDAHCPHLGANLADGTVKQGCIECPFHKWRLAGDGCVKSIPYTDQVQSSLRTRAWPVCEMHGMIFFYFTAGRKAGPEPIIPDFPLAPVDDITSEDLVYRGSYDAGTVDMHLVEFAENSVDFQHFEPLHGKMLVPFVGLPIPLFQIQHEATWEPDEHQDHIAYFHNKAVVKFRENPMPSTAASATITFHGPGTVVTFRFHIPKVGEIVLYQTHTPLAPLKQEIRFRWFAEPHIPRILVYYVVGNWVSQWRADIGIWENKVYKAKPMLVAGDGPVHRMRKWYKQFYAKPTYENSETNATTT